MSFGDSVWGPSVALLTTELSVLSFIIGSIINFYEQLSMYDVVCLLVSFHNE